jgi:pyridoxine 5-phosphate synthase
MIELVGGILEVHPNRHRVTLVPENPTEITTEGGLNVVKHQQLIQDTAKALKKKDIWVSLFVDPVPEQIQASNLEGIDMIEINTAQYADGDTSDLQRISTAAKLAESLGLIVAAGHGLTHHNLAALVQEVPEIIEYNIGHSIVSRAVFVGWETAIRDILDIIKS